MTAGIYTPPIQENELTCGGMIVKSLTKRGGISRRSVTSKVAGIPMSMNRISNTRWLNILVIWKQQEQHMSGWQINKFNCMIKQSDILMSQKFEYIFMILILPPLWTTFLCVGRDRTCHWRVLTPGTQRSSGRSNYIDTVRIEENWSWTWKQMEKLWETLFV